MKDFFEGWVIDAYDVSHITSPEGISYSSKREALLIEVFGGCGCYEDVFLSRITEGLSKMEARLWYELLGGAQGA